MSTRGFAVLRTPLVFGVAATLTLSAGLALSGSAAQAAPTDIPVHIFTFNDFHGRIDGTVGADGVTVTGSTAMNFAYTLENLALADPDNSMVVSAGDNVGASLFASSIAGDTPTIKLLNDLAAATNFKASSLGNHEFDTGLSGLQGTIMPQMSGWAYTSANVVDKTTGAPVFPPYTIYTLGNGLTVGVVAADTTETPSLVTPGGIATLSFTDPVTAVNKYADQLKDGDTSNGEADIVVAVYHDGSPVSTSLADGMAASASFARIVNATDANVSAIVGGHTHMRYVWNDATGRPVIQAASYGAFVGQIDLAYDPTTGKASLTGASTNQSAIPAGVDPTTVGNMALVQQHLASALSASAALANQTVGKISGNITTAHTNGQWLNGTYQNTGTAVRDNRAAESSLATLVADAFLWTGNNSSAIPDHNIDIGIINAGGGLRSELCMNGIGVGSNTCLDTNGDGLISYAEANAILPFANNLWTLSLTGAQFKQFLEEQWQTSDTSGTRPTRPFLATGLSSNVTFTVNTDDPSAAPCMFDSAAGCGWNDPKSHITSVWVNGQPLQADKVYNILTISFLPNGGGDNYRVMNHATNVKDTGLLDRDAWIAYLMNQSGITALGGTPAKAIAPSFARQSVVISGGSPALAPMTPLTAAAGSQLQIDMARLDLTSLGSPSNTRLKAYLVPLTQASLAAPPESMLVETEDIQAWDDPDACTGASFDSLLPTTHGCHGILVDIPVVTAPGNYEIVTIAQPSGTTVRTALTVTPPAIGTAVLANNGNSTLTGGWGRLANGTDAYGMTLTLRDPAGQPITGAAPIIAFTKSNNPAYNFAPIANLKFSTVTETAPGVYGFTITSTTAGLYAYQVMLGGTPVNGQTYVANFLGATVQAGSIVVGQTQTAQATGFGPTEAITATVSPGSVSLGPLTATTDGKVSVTFPTSGLAAGAHTISFKSVSNGTVSASFTVVPAPTPAGTVITVQPGSSTATGGTARAADGKDGFTLTVALTDAAGKPVTGAAAHLTATSTPAGVTASAFKDNGNGTYTATLTASVPGNYSVTAARDGAALGSAVKVNFIGGDMAKASVQAGDTATSDGLGFLPTEKVRVTVNSTPMDLGSFTPDATGKVSVTFPTAGLAAGAHTVTYTGSVSGTAIVPFTVTAATTTVQSPQVETGGSMQPSVPLGVVSVALLMMVAGAVLFFRGRELAR